jgi:uncharacterized membrane protein
MELALVMKLLHIFSVIWTVTGVIGRGFILSKATNAEDIRSTNTILQVSAPFERLMAQFGSLLILVTGILTAWAQGWRLFAPGSVWLLVSIVLFLSLIPLIALVFIPKGRIFGEALDEANKQGVVTPALRAAFHDRTVSVAHTYELATIVVVVALMVLKPF